MLAPAKIRHNMKIIIYLLLFCTLIISCKKEALKAPPVDAITVINMGISGNTAENLLNRINTVIKQAPNLVIIMIGTNDALDGSSTYNSFSSTLSIIIDSLQHTGSSVMLLTPPPIQTWNTITTNSNGVYSIYFKDICNIIYNLSESKACYYVDIDGELNNILTSANSHQLFLSDGVHPSAQGDKDIASDIFSYMKTQNVIAKKIVCFGDSITFGAYLAGQGTATGDTYPAALSNDLNDTN